MAQFATGPRNMADPKGEAGDQYDLNVDVEMWLVVKIFVRTSFNRFSSVPPLKFKIDTQNSHV